MGGTISQTRFERVPTPSYDSPLLGGNTPGSDEERLEQYDLADNVTPTPHDSPLPRGHTPGSNEGFGNQQVEKESQKIGKKQRARTPGMKLFKIGTSRRKSLDKENVSKHGRNLKTKPMFEKGDFDDDFDDIDDMVNEAMENVEGDAVNTATTGETPPTTTTTALEDKDLTIAQTLVKMRSQKDKEKGNGVAFRAAQEESARPTRILPTIDLKDKEAKDAALIEQIEDIQARMDAEELLVERRQQEEREQFTIEERSRMLVEMIDERKSRKGKAKGSRKKTISRKRTGEKLDDESVKRQKLEDDAEKEELRAYLDIIPGDDEVVNVESLATKYLIVD
ncbi:hypothetical protein Tco_1096193 [Tanacetum coccineum]